MSRPDSDLLARVSDFLVAEAELLDDRLLDTWFALFERAARYWVLLAGATGRPGAGGQPVHHRRRPRAPARAGRQHPRRAYLDGAAALAHPPPGGQCG
ncbi:aromatic-ring-hydroxylating dioxygenase subunit beta [Pseudomonas aeruginosa]|nr:aromatic-ring-hydroxylating dioxygenase subunit beta [Pseudomonas aeruginosa]